LEGYDDGDDILNDMKIDAIMGFEHGRGSDEESDLGDDNLYLTPNGKFDLLNEYFGISALALPPCAGNERRMKKAVKHLKRVGALVSGDYAALWHIISVLKAQNENKKNAKDIEQWLVPLLMEKHFFKHKQPMSKKDLLEVCNFAKYEVMQPGDTVFKQGDAADKCYIILKGSVSVQIPDPTGQGLVVPKKPVEAEGAAETSDEEDDKGKILTKEELEALPPREQRKYKTRIMLQEILSSQNVKRSTVSLSQAINR
jgi:hypothetical protein